MRQSRISICACGLLWLVASNSDSESIASQCSEGLCEEGLQIGGYYQSGGEGYSGQYFNGNVPGRLVLPPCSFNFSKPPSHKCTTAPQIGPTAAAHTTYM